MTRGRGVPSGVFEHGFVSATPIVAGAPCYTQDGRIWDGAVLYRPIADRWGGSEAALLRAVDVMVESTDCGTVAGTYRGDLRVLPESQRRTIARAGFVRFADGGWRVEAWESEDGRLLGLLGGEVSRPRLR